MPAGKVKKLWTVRKRSTMAGVTEVYENQRYYGVGWCALSQRGRQYFV